MDQNNLQLDEASRTKLDGIVQQMQNNKEPDQNIQAVVNDFKQKYGSSAQPQKDTQTKQSFNPLQDITGAGPQQKTDNFLPSVFQSTVGSKGIGGIAQGAGAPAALSEYAFGGDKQTKALYDQANKLSQQSFDYFQQAKTATDPAIKQKYLDVAKSLNESAQNIQSHAKDIQGFTDTTPGQALGTGANAALTVATGGTANLAEDAAKGAIEKYGTNLTAKNISNIGKVVTSPITKVAENAGVGAGYQVASNLQDNRALNDGVASSAAFMAAIPLIGKGLGMAKDKILGGISNSSQEFGNTLINAKKTDYAYGHNPVNALKNEGFTSSNMPDLANEVTSRKAEIGSQIGIIGDKLEKIGTPLNLNPSLEPIAKAQMEAVKSNNPTLLQRLQDFKDALTKDLTQGVDEHGNPMINKGSSLNLDNQTYSGAVDFMNKVSNWTKFTGFTADEKTLNKVGQQVYGKTREIMNQTAQQADPQLGQALLSLNKRYGDISSLEYALQRKETQNAASKIVNFTTSKFSMPLYVGTAVATGVITGSWKRAGEVLLGELGVSAAGHLSQNPKVVRNVMNLLDNLAPQAKQGIFNSTPVLKNLYERLGGSPEAPTTAPLTKTAQGVNAITRNLGVAPEDMSKLQKFFGLGKKAAERAGMGDQYNKVMGLLEAPTSNATGPDIRLPVSARETNLGLHEVRNTKILNK